MKIRVSVLRKMIHEELSRSGEDADVMARVRTHDDKQRANYASAPAPMRHNDLPNDRVAASFPGALEAHPEPDTARFWEEGGSLNSVDRVRGHKTRMIFGKDGNWHKFYNDARVEPGTDRRAPGRRSFNW